MRSLKVLRAIHGENHPDVSLALNDMALLSYTHGRLSEAEELYKKALAVNMSVFGPTHPETKRAEQALNKFYQVTGSKPSSVKTE